MKLAKRPKASVSDLLSSPLQGTILADTPSCVLQKTNCSCDKHRLHVGQNGWQQTQAAHCLATQDNRAENKDQHSVGFSAVPGLGGKDSLNLVLKALIIHDKLRWKKKDKCPPVEYIVVQNYIKILTKTWKSPAHGRTRREAAWCVNEWMIALWGTPQQFPQTVSLSVSSPQICNPHFSPVSPHCALPPTVRVFLLTHRIKELKSVSSSDLIPQPANKHFSIYMARLDSSMPLCGTGIRPLRVITVR